MEFVGSDIVIHKPTFQQISSHPSEWLHVHYLVQNFTFLQTCPRIYLCCLIDLPNELLFHQAALTSILWCVFCDVITEFLNITCNIIWMCWFEKNTLAHTFIWSKQTESHKRTTYCNVCWKTKHVEFPYET